MIKRMLLMLAVVVVVVASLGYYKTKQIQAAVKAHTFAPPPEAITTVVAKPETWPATMSVVGTTVAIHGVTISADLPGTVSQISFDSGRTVQAGEVLAELDTRQERADLADTKEEYEKQQKIADDWVQKALATKKRKAEAKNKTGGNIVLDPNQK